MLFNFIYGGFEMFLGGGHVVNNMSFAKAVRLLHNVVFDVKIEVQVFSPRQRLHTVF